VKPVVLLLLLVFASAGFSQDYTVMSVATSDDALAVFANPAALAAGRAPNVAFLYTENIDTLRRFGFAGATPVMGVGYSYWSKGQKRSMFSYSSSFKLGGSASFGARGRWMNLVPGRYFALDFGLLIRPARYLSVGAVANNVNRPGIGRVSYDRNYRVGLGLRPMTDRYTLFGEWGAVEGEDIDESYYQFGVEMEPLDGIVLKGSVDRDLTFKAGLSVNFLNTSVGYTASLDTVDGLRESGVQLVYSVDRNRTVLGKSGEIAEVRITGGIEDVPPGFSLFGGRATSLSRILEQLRKAKEDKTVSAVLLNIRSFSAGTGTIYEIRRAIEDLKGAGKRVVAYLEEGGMDLAMYLASAAERVVVCPSAEIIVKGPYAQVMMIKGLLDKIGVEADIVRAGKYKSAAEQLTREKLSEEAREEYQDLVDGMFDGVTAEIFLARNISMENRKEILKQGAMRPDQAKSLGLVDDVGYYDDAKLVVAELLGRKAQDPDRVGTVGMRKRVYRQYCWVKPPTVAVVLASGAIVTGPSRTDFLYGSQFMGSETVVKQLRRLRVDKSIKAVVLRVDSPGGDGLASDLIWREVTKIRKSGKPIVVSMSDVAASGGYYISCSASKIFADPTTITGSIGVFGGKAVLAGTYDKLGINPEIIKSAEHSDALSPARKFTEEERERLQEQIDYFYDDFVIKVSEGRGLDKEKVHEIAQGRVYTGVRAKTLGLVDEIGTLQDAIEAAAEMANIKEKPRVVYVSQKKGFAGRISGCTTCHGLFGSIDNN